MNDFTSYETSKALHEAGFRGRHDHIWARYYDKLSVHAPELKSLDSIIKLASWRDVVPASTFSVIWKALPWSIQLPEHLIELQLYKGPLETGCGYEYEDHKGMYVDFGPNNNPIEAAAQLLLWCIENGHVKV